MTADGAPGAPVDTPPEGRATDLGRVRDALLDARRIVLTTHVNADGDGSGSEVALAHWLEARGIEVTIVNPTPFPDAFGFLLDGRRVFTPSETRGRRALEAADLIGVLDTSEPSRLGQVADYLARARVAVIDHHPASPKSVGEVVARDPSACATGELIWDLFRLEDHEPELAEARGIYVAIVTDTGSFRFGNTTGRAHGITERLIHAGVDVEDMFRHLFARFTLPALELLRKALASLETDMDGRLAWITLRHSDIRETGASPEDREGLVEYARRLQGVEVALLFRELADGRSKVSARSNGEVDVAEIARQLGGGGHRQAAGILLDDPLERARERVLARARERIGAEVGGPGSVT